MNDDLQPQHPQPEQKKEPKEQHHVPKWFGTLTVFAYHVAALYLLVAPKMDLSQRAFGILMAFLTVGGRAFLPLIEHFLKTLTNKKH
jgi:hypothetical protein